MTTRSTAESIRNMIGAAEGSLEDAIAGAPESELDRLSLTNLCEIYTRLEATVDARMIRREQAMREAQEETRKTEESKEARDRIASALERFFSKERKS